jgi:sugar fermentation stimulation protein A
MLGLAEPGSLVYLSHHDDPKRKLSYTWELVRLGRYLAGVNPILANRLLAEAIEHGRIAELTGYPNIRREVALANGSRIDVRLEADDRPPCWVGVKSATLVQDGIALFPDAPTERGRRHLADLQTRVRKGDRAVLCFVVQRGDASSVAPADAIDPAYGIALRNAHAAGVELLAYRARVGTRAITLRDPLPVQLRRSSED